jgi:thioredoxin 1
MEEGDAFAFGAATRHLIDELHAGSLAPRQRGVEVADSETDVMDARSALGEELPDGGIGFVRLKEFDEGIPGGEAGDARAIGVIERDGRQAEQVAVERQDRFERLHGDADVGNGGLLVVHAHNFVWGATMGKTMAVTDENFLAEVEQHKGLAVVDFWATWCGPCRMIAPILEQLSDEFAGRVKVTKLDVDANQRTAMRFQVRSIPTLLFFKDGKLVDQVIGAVPKPALAAKFEQHAA